MGVMHFESGSSVLVELWASPFFAILVDYELDGVLHTGPQLNHSSDGSWTPFDGYIHHHFCVFFVTLHTPNLSQNLDSQGVFGVPHDPTKEKKPKRFSTISIVVIFYQGIEFTNSNPRFSQINGIDFMNLRTERQFRQITVDSLPPDFAARGTRTKSKTTTSPTRPYTSGDGRARHRTPDSDYRLRRRRS